MPYEALVVTVLTVSPLTIQKRLSDQYSQGWRLVAMHAGKVESKGVASSSDDSVLLIFERQVEGTPSDSN
jgi:hypothetical protein